jgi:transposase
VLKVEEWVSIREMARQGVSVSEIARRTGRDRKSVRKVLAGLLPSARATTWKEGAGKLAPYREYLVQRVGEGCWNGAVLFEEICARGYTGKTSILRGFLAPLRAEAKRQREATVRFETGPGKQAQVDWGEFGRIWDGGERRWRKLYGFVFTLGYSRAQHLSFTTSCDLEHFLGCHIEAFEALGLPEQVLYDNLKTAILGRSGDGSPIFPGRFLDFALYYGFTPKFCRPYRPQTKGKVERGVGYVRQNFWVRVAVAVRAGGLELAELNRRARDWVGTVAQPRVHGTHREVVVERYAREAPHLGRASGRPRFDTDYHALRRVGRDGRISYRGQLYQLPWAQASGEVLVDESLAGVVTVRTKGGVALDHRPVRIEPGQPAAPALSAEAAVRAAELLMVAAGPPPSVETRDLAVYEEVAQGGLPH